MFNKTSTFHRWVYRRVYVADGNFKADHVRQPRSEGELWLWDGSGMMPNRPEYKAFLASATQRHTVNETFIL